MHDSKVVAFDAGNWFCVWHVEPGGRDAGSVCRHYRRGPHNEVIVTWAWRWHVHHWRIQLPWVQRLRRRLLTRCEWCGGPSRPGDPANVASGWDGRWLPHWWSGERGLFHARCLTAAQEAGPCTCTDPVASRGRRCHWCGGWAR